LLGIVRAASSDGERALLCFNKALYLDPSYYEAIVHLALLHEQRGELSQANNLRRRAERSQRKRDAK
jgi:chemotaxis protein methyltransferase WspC